MILHEIGIGNFKSIGDEPVWINLEKKINIFIGANNSGKSNILKALEWVCTNRNLEAKISPIDIHKRDEKNLLRISLKASFEEADRIDMVSGNVFLLDFKIQENMKDWIKVPTDLKEREDVKHFNKLLRKFKGHILKEWPDENQRKGYINNVYQEITNQLLNKLPQTFYIPQFRQIIPGKEYTIKGQGIVEMLASWQHPEITDDENVDKFLKIQNLLRRLLKLDNIEMEVVHTKDHIIVKNGDLRLPLESYGTGVHELIILAVAVYSAENSMFLIEEPEIHLHPRLQKEFLNFIIKETSNKYLITTHSNAFIQPSAEVEVVHLKLSNESTKGMRVESSENVLEIFNDLGISPSDILQSNSVLWVEGPSDRIYLNGWIKILFPDLIEGIDYTIMFYGGKLLSHLSLDRDFFPNPFDLIPLLRINQKSVIIIDSDRKKRGARISETKMRVKSECVKNNIYCWITDGKEIENYLSNESLTLAYNDITGLETDLSIENYDELERVLESSFGKKWRKKWSYNAAKPKFARKIVQYFNKGDISPELKSHLNRVYKIIKNSK
jgi:predicted ATP-dependent endonuclease of OLD family